MTDNDDLLVAYQHGADWAKHKVSELKSALAEARMKSLADLGQAQDAYEAQKKAEAERDQFVVLSDALQEVINQMRAIVEAD